MNVYSAATFSGTALYSTSSSTTTGLSDISLDASTKYYVNIWANGSAATYNLTVSRTGDAPNDGTLASPVALSLDTPFSGKVGGSGGSYIKSYYAFTVTNAGAYSISMTGGNSGYDLNLYKYSSFTTSVGSATAATGIVNTYLSAQTYYLLVENWYDTTTDGVYSLTVNRIADYPNEGSVAVPVGLDVGTAHSGRVGGSSSSYYYSYYQFTATAGAVCNVTLSGLNSNVYIDIYSNANFTGSTLNSVRYTQTGTSTTTLTQGTTYYVRIYNYYFDLGQAYTIKVSQ
jgi:hypothetical protein